MFSGPKSGGALAFAAALLAIAPPAQGTTSLDTAEPAVRHYECVPIARALSGIQIYGDAWTWWDQAEGVFRRGNAPRRGAVLAFKPFGNMRLGHVAAVSKVVDDRTILVTHSNWSPYDGRRGRVEKDVRVIDVSDENDWSAVRVWYGPLGDLGTTHWPVHGFIYPQGKSPMVLPADAPPANLPGFRMASAIPQPAAKPDLKLDMGSILKAERANAPGNHPLSASPAPQWPKPTGRLAYLGRELKRLR